MATFECDRTTVLVTPNTRIFQRWAKDFELTNVKIFVLFLNSDLKVRYEYASFQIFAVLHLKNDAYQ